MMIGKETAGREGAVAQRILIVEDERAIADSVSVTLKREGYDTRAAYDGETGLGLAEEFKPDLVILDLMLPGIGGLDVCRMLRRRSSVPIIMLTAKAEEVDRVVGLEVGADDYVTKPFSMRELVARVRAALRRQSMLAYPPEQPGFDDGHLTVDLTRPSVAVNGKPVALSPRELSLLRALLAHRGRARTRHQLLEEAWGSDEYIDPRTVDVHIRWLRQKIEPDPEHPRYIETIRGIGYRFAI
jgi:DNA-binding response OmpR family regulator